MAVILMEGFDHLSAAQLLNKGWSVAPSSVQTGRLGGQCARWSNTTNTTTKTFAAAATVIVGYAYRPVTLNANDHFVIRAGTTNAVRVQTVASGGGNVLRLLNSGGTQVAIGTTQITINTWYYIEVKAFQSGASGTVELYLNGVSEIASTTANVGSANFDNIGIAISSGATQDYDDIYVVDTTGSSPTNTFLGDVRVETLAATSEGANTAWTLGAGASKTAAVSDATSYDSDTGYIHNSTPGDRQTFGMADLAISSGTVFAVQTNLVARKDDAGTRTIAPVIRLGGVNYDGTTSAGLSTSYLVYSQIYDRLDPAGNAWSVTNVNAMETGVKTVA